MASSESRPLLLDVNALLALAWPNHQFHRTVPSRLERRPAPEWATCALTQLGFVRLSSNPAVVRDRGHRYVERLPPLGQADKYFRRLLGHRQVTDAYLLAVAATNNAVLLTLDRRLTPHAAARPHVEVATP